MIRHLFKVVWNRKRSNALIVTEIFVSFLVVFAVLAGLITVASNWKRPIGFEWRDVWDVRLALEADTMEADATTKAALTRILTEVEALPEVASAALAKTPPYSGSTSSARRRVNGRDVEWNFDSVSDGYRETMRMQVLRGRWFDRSDDGAQHKPVVVDVNAARAIWGDADPIGQTIEEEQGVFLRVIGVVPEFRKDGETGQLARMVFHRYDPETSAGEGGNHLIVRLRPGTGAEFEEKLLAVLRGIAPDVSFRVRPMDQMRQRSIRAVLMPLATLGLIGVFLVAMVALGLTGVLWQNVTRRTREIGVRRALGATGTHVHRQVLGEVFVLTTLALAAGSAIVLQLPILGVFSIVTPQMFAIALTAALAAIYLLTLLCALYPSWLASRLQPADALRYE